MSKLIGLLKKYKWYVLVAIIVLIIGYRFTHKQVVSPFETVAATRANVVQEVSVTGRVDADSEASLSFEKSGRITAVFVDVGDKVAR
jgi:multidrug efflux pump subunit AcrA (membrane-fusion protein)